MSPVSSLAATSLLWVSLSAGVGFRGAFADAPPAQPRQLPDVGAVGIVLRDSEPLPADLRSRTAGAPCSVLVRIGAETLADPGRFDPTLETAAGAGLRIAVGIPLPGWERASPAEVDDWAARAGAFARHVAGRVAAYQILEDVTPDARARDYAYLLKHAAVAIRAADPRVRIVSAGLGPEDAAWLQDLYDQDAAPYLDVLASRDLPSLGAVADLRDRLDANAAVWVAGATIDSPTPRSEALRAYVDARAAGAETVLFGPPLAPALPGFLAEMRTLFPPALAPASPAALPFDPAAATLTPAGPSPVRIAGFYDPRSRDGLALYDAPGAAPEEGRDTVTVRFPLRSPVESVDLYDPETSTVVPIGTQVPAGRVLYAPVRSTGLLLRFRLATEALPVQESQIGATSELTAEEIIAFERQTSTAQAQRLKHYEARASVAIHYAIAAVAQSVDVLSENRLYVHEGKEDYEQTGLYVDGARWRGKKPPYLPFIQPDKVKEVPLTISLDEGYRYTLVKREKTDDRDCYVIAFEPKVAGLSLYEGRIYIDSRLFTRVRMDAVQIGLTPPLRANQVTYRFGPVDGPDGPYWLPQAVDGQMVFEVLGQSLVVERQARYSEFTVNQDAFETRLAEAYGSGRPLFRETDEGYYKLDASGREEILTSASTPRNTFLVMGIGIGSTGLPSAPFAGVNFFDFNYRNTGTQVNVAWAGPFLDLSWTDPHVTHPGPGGVPIAFAAQGTFIGVPLRDKNARDDVSTTNENIDVYHEQVLASFALPMGHFLKWTLQGRTTYLDFSRRHETDDAFILPVTTVETGGLLRLEFNRSGYTFGAWGENARRSAWKRWGLPANPFDPADRDYTRLGIDARKAVYLGEFRKIGLGLSGFDGRSLDRFSRFELGDFRSARVRGFNGSGFHFDRGLVLDTSYAFTVRDVLRVDTGLQAGWIKSVDDFGPGYVRVVGAGLALEFSGPWSTLMNVRYGRALESSLPGRSGGGSDVRFVMFKTFDKWSRKPKP